MATARSLFFALPRIGPMHRSPHGLDGNGNESLKWLRAPNPNLQWAFGDGVAVAFHAGIEREAAKLFLGIPTLPDPKKGLQIKFSIAFDETLPVCGKLEPNPHAHQFRPTCNVYEPAPLDCLEREYKPRVDDVGDSKAVLGPRENGPFITAKRVAVVHWRMIRRGSPERTAEDA